MYFDIAPKDKRKDFFNYAYEYNELKTSINRKEKIIALIGARRVGKTSMMNVFYHETELPKVWIDGRIIENPKKEIPSIISDIVESGKSKIIGKIEGLSVSAFGFGVGVNVIPKKHLNEIENKIKKFGRLVVFIDEAQRMNHISLADIVSYFYDRFPEITFILSGSEVGLMNDVLGSEKIGHPLHGRDITRININRFDKDRSFEFLKAGFEQAGQEVKQDEIMNVINELDGLVGWLTLYGYKKAIMKNKDPLKVTIEMASQVAASELASFLKNRKGKKLYLYIIRHANGISWTELKSRIEKEWGEVINPNSLTFALDQLLKYSFVEKKEEKYLLSDPLLFKATFLL